MPYVFLVQHAEAKKKEEDPERRITEKGAEETEKIAKYFSTHIKITIDKIIHSTKTRAKQTAEILAKYLNPKEVREEKDLEPLADPKIWAEKIKNISENIMIVGHLPHLSKLLSLLVTGRDDLEIVKFRYSNIVCLEKSEDQNWRIIWILRPDIIP
ncbi:MAG: phosphohistidine phosphatase SixA [Candidatus Njordarchaeales archaeon]